MSLAISSMSHPAMHGSGFCLRLAFENAIVACAFTTQVFPLNSTKVLATLAGVPVVFHLASQPQMLRKFEQLPSTVGEWNG